MSQKLTVEDWQNRLNALNQPLIILNRQVLKHKKDIYTIQCFKCGNTFKATKNALMSAYLKIKKDTRYTRWCPVCNHKIIVVGYNDLATTRGDLVKYFVNPEEAKQYSHQSHKKALLICPDYKKTKNMRIADLCKHGFNCDYCNDNISIGEKIIRNLFFQLPIVEYNFEFKDLWTHNKRYDVHFIYKNEKYLIEIDGEQHNKDTTWTTAEKQKKNDIIKTQLATQNGYELIRIEAYCSDFDYIKNNIINSRLSEIFDLSNIDWSEIYRQTVTSRNIEIAEYYTEHQDITINDIAKHFHTHRTVISHILIKLARVGLCNYTKKDVFLNGRKCSGKNRVANNDLFDLISPNDEHIGTYKSLDECYRTHLFLFEKLKINPQKLKRLAFVGDSLEGYRIEYQIGLYEYHKKNHPIVLEVCDLYKQGLSPYDIAKIKSISHSSVYRYLAAGNNMGICNYCRKKRVTNSKGEQVT